MLHIGGFQKLSLMPHITINVCFSAGVEFTSFLGEIKKENKQKIEEMIDQVLD